MSNASRLTFLPSRGVIAVSGPDARELLQGLITNDVDLVSETCAIYAALLTPQGKLMFDFFIIERDGRLLLDCHKDHLPALLKRLTMYRLRAQVELEDLSAKYRIAVAFDGDATGDGLPGAHFTDPRLDALGHRLILADDEDIQANAAEADFETWRLSLGVPNIPADAGQDKTFMLEANFDELHGVDFAKGCYIGQELASRMKRRNGLRKRLLPVNVDGPLPPEGTPIMAGDRNLGDMRTGIGNRAIAFLRVDRLKEAQGNQLTADGIPLVVDWPDWIPDE